MAEQAFANKAGDLDVGELQQALRGDGLIFDLPDVRHIIRTFGTGTPGRLSWTDFQGLQEFITSVQKGFDSFTSSDADHSRAIEAQEIQKALQQAGLQLDGPALEALMSRPGPDNSGTKSRHEYTRKRLFLQSCVRTFKGLGPQGQGQVRLNFNQWVRAALQVHVGCPGVLDDMALRQALVNGRLDHALTQSHMVFWVDRQHGLDVKELQWVLQTGKLHYPLPDVDQMIRAFDTRECMKLTYTDYKRLYDCLVIIHSSFACFEAADSGRVHLKDVPEALQRAGFQLEKDVLHAVLLRHTDSDRSDTLSLGGFIRMCLFLEGCVRVFKKLDSQGVGLVLLSFNQWVNVTFKMRVDASNLVDAGERNAGARHHLVDQPDSASRPPREDSSGELPQADVAPHADAGRPRVPAESELGQALGEEALAVVKSKAAAFFKDNSGRATATELQSLMQQGNLNFSLPDVLLMIRAFGTGAEVRSLRFPDFERLCAFLIDVYKGFDWLTRDKHLQVLEAQQELKRLGFPLNVPVLNAMMSRHDPDGSDTLSLDKYIRMCLFLQSCHRTFAAFDPQRTGHIRLDWDHLVYAASHVA